MALYDNTMSSSALSVVSEQALADRETRIKDAQILEVKLKFINENVQTRIQNVCSSSAGAGSGDFHQYRMVRRSEQERVRKMEEDWKKNEEKETYETNIQDKQKMHEDKTSKRRAKRQKKKAKKKSRASDGSAAPEEITDDSDGELEQVTLD